MQYVKYMPWFIVFTVESFHLNVLNASGIVLCTLNSYSRICGETAAVSEVKMCVFFNSEK